MELPFDDDEVAPLQEDDPRPQRVPQYPAGSRRSARGAESGRAAVRDREMSTRFDTNEYSDPGHAPAFLYVEKGPGAGQLIPVKQGPLVIGRASACDLRLQHPSISRRHAQLMRTGERFLLRDLSSQNGTFVAREKIRGDTEIQVGDEISLGNAVLRLRGSGGSSDQVPKVSLPNRLSKRTGSSPTRVALAAAAIGSGVAALLTLSFLKLTGPDLGAVPGSGSSTSSTAYVPPPPAPTEAPSAPESEASPRALKPLQARAEAAPPSAESKTPGPRAASIRSKPSSASAKGSPRQESNPQVDRAEILALYEKGDVQASLRLARGARLEPLATRIAEFQSAMDAGQKALSARNTPAAIQHLSTALVVDQELSHGWSVQARKLRKQLGQLHVLTGVGHVKAGSRDAARESFELALKYDASNARAKAELKKLGAKK